MDTNRAGEIAEQKVVTRLLEMGFTVSRPVLEVRYDLIVEIDNELVKVQVKKGTEDNQRSDAYRANLYRQKRHGNREWEDVEYGDGEVDAFVLTDKVNDKIYWFWKEEAPNSEVRRKYDNLESEKIGLKLSG